MDRWARIAGLVILLVLMAIGYSLLLKHHRRRSQELAETLSSGLVGIAGPGVRARRSKVQQVIIAVGVMLVVEVVAVATGTDDELHRFLSSCRRGRDW